MTEQAPPPPPEQVPPPAPEPPAPPPKSVDVEALAGAVIEAAPTPPPLAEAEAKAAAPQVEARFASLRDRAGNTFNPRLHLTNPDGTPKLTPRGLLWGRPGVVLQGPGAGEGAQARTLDLGAAGGREPDDDDEEDDDDDDAPEVDQVEGAPGQAATKPPAQLTEEQRKRLAVDTAEVTVQLIQALGKFVAGKDGAFKRDDENGDEYRDLKQSYVAWYETMENLVHVSPGWIVAVNTGRYMSRCASTETGQRRIEKGTRWAGSAWSKVRLMWHTWRATAKS